MTAVTQRDTTEKEKEPWVGGRGKQLPVAAEFKRTN